MSFLVPEFCTQFLPAVSEIVKEGKVGSEEGVKAGTGCIPQGESTEGGIQQGREAWMLGGLKG